MDCVLAACAIYDATGSTLAYSRDYSTWYDATGSNVLFVPVLYDATEARSTTTPKLQKKHCTILRRQI
jgi:hypothetical protein